MRDAAGCSPPSASPSNISVPVDYSNEIFCPNGRNLRNLPWTYSRHPCTCSWEQKRYILLSGVFLDPPWRGRWCRICSDTPPAPSHISSGEPKVCRRRILSSKICTEGGVSNTRSICVGSSVSWALWRRTYSHSIGARNRSCPRGSNEKNV